MKKNAQTNEETIFSYNNVGAYAVEYADGMYHVMQCNDAQHAAERAREEHPGVQFTVRRV